MEKGAAEGFGDRKCLAFPTRSDGKSAAADETGGSEEKGGRSCTQLESLGVEWLCSEASDKSCNGRQTSRFSTDVGLEGCNAASGANEMLVARGAREINLLSSPSPCRLACCRELKGAARRGHSAAFANSAQCVSGNPRPTPPLVKSFHFKSSCVTSYQTYFVAYSESGLLINSSLAVKKILSSQ